MNPVTLPITLVNQLLTEAQQHPDTEVCGLIGRADSGADGRISRYPVTNVAEDPTRLFELDAEGMFAAIRLMRERGEEHYAIYHSHPHGPALPSPTDRELAAYPDVLYLIISLGTTGVLEMRGFMLDGDGVDEVPLEGR
jgi:proteasome lid subunit RPN8/RPN11